MTRRRMILACIAMLPLIFSCTNPDSTSNGEAEKNSITICFGTSGASRTVSADLVSNADGFDITLTSGDGYASKTRTVSGADSVTFTEVEVGSWDIDVAAKKGGVTVGTGSLTDQSLSAGAALNVSVPISFTQTGSGSLNLRLSFPLSSGIDSVSGTIAGKTLSPTLTKNGDNYEAVLGADSLTSGSQNLVITFKRGELVTAVITEAVNIWDNVTSDKWIGDDGKLASTMALEAADVLVASASLSALAVSAGTLDPVFSPGTTSYDAGTVNALSVTVTPTASSPGQYIQCRVNGSDWAEVASGASKDLGLSAGTNTIDVRVTAPDRQTTRTYTISCTLKAATPTLVGDVTVLISIANPSTQVLSFSSTDISIARGNKLTVSTTNASLAAIESGWEWRVDGILDSANATNAFSWDTTGKQPGQYLISAAVTCGGLKYSGYFRVTLTY